MSWWTITPHDPLIIRDGRPNASAQSQSMSLPFVPPTTLAGAARTRLGSNGEGTFVATTEAELAALKDVPIRGPLLARWAEDGKIDEIYVPRPRDAVFFEEPTALRQLRPTRLDESVLMDGASSLGVDLEPLCLPREKNLGKPSEKAPQWWSTASLELWLSNPTLGPHHLSLERSLSDLPRDRRVHVAIAVDKQVADDGKLFQTDGLSFVVEDVDEQRRRAVRRYTLVADVGSWSNPLSPGTGFLGGERRLVRWDPLATAPLATPPPAVLEAVGKGARARVRVVLLTPGHFALGWRPAPDGFLLSERVGVHAKLVAAKVDRPETISGWSVERRLNAKGESVQRGPKPTKRLAPAGSVYWLELEGPSAARQAWVKETWMKNVSDGAAERNDGLGLAVVGVADA